MSTKYATLAEATSAFASHRAELEALGVIMEPTVVSYLTEPMRHKYQLAMDAVPTLNTSPNGALPTVMTTFVDPKVYEILFAPMAATEVAPERKVGDWTDTTALFPVVEQTFETAAYGDFVNNGRAGMNANFPARESFLFQIIKEYGDLAVDKAAKANINLPAQLDAAAANGLNRFANTAYFSGIQGLQNYGLLNDPFLPSSLSPGTKAAGNGNVWIYNGVIQATANEIFADIQSLVIKLIAQSGGLVNSKSAMTLGMSPANEGALSATNSFGISVNDLIAKNYPNLKIVTAVQYGVQAVANPDGLVAGNMLQLFADEVNGQQTAETIFNEKMRSHGLVRQTSSYQQKVTGGVFGAVIHQPFAVASMIGI